VAGDDLSERLVDGLNAAYGIHPGYRAAHAKGVLCAAEFAPSQQAASLSRAPHLQGPGVRAHVRFSNGSGDPSVADGVRDARGMAVKFYLPDGSRTDIVTLSLPAFFARTPEELLLFNEARRPDPATGQPDVGKVTAYLADHPEAVPAVTRSPPATRPSPITGCTRSDSSPPVASFAMGAIISSPMRASFRSATRKPLPECPTTYGTSSCSD
jgi:catalase